MLCHAASTYLSSEIIQSSDIFGRWLRFRWWWRGRIIVIILIPNEWLCKGVERCCDTGIISGG